MAYDYQTDRERVMDLVKHYGEVRVGNWLATAEHDIAETVKRVNLPEKFRFFTKSDWDGFNGATRFVDGVEPISGSVLVDIDLPDLGVNNGASEFCVIIGGDEATNKSNPVNAVTDLCFSNDNTDLIYQRIFTDRAAALALFHLLQRSGGLVKLSELISVFGFVRIN